MRCASLSREFVPLRAALFTDFFFATTATVCLSIVGDMGRYIAARRLPLVARLRSVTTLSGGAKRDDVGSGFELVQVVGPLLHHGAACV